MIILFASKLTVTLLVTNRSVSTTIAIKILIPRPQPSRHIPRKRRRPLHIVIQQPIRIGVIKHLWRRRPSNPLVKPSPAQRHQNPRRPRRRPATFSHSRWSTPGDPQLQAEIIDKKLRRPPPCPLHAQIPRSPAPAILPETAIEIPSDNFRHTAAPPTCRRH